MKTPVFTHGTYENTIKAIQEGRIKYPGYCWITDKELYGFINKNNELEYIGIPVLTGTLEKEIILSDLDDGLYEIKGQHKITSDSETIYIAGSNIICIVETVGEIKKIKRITSDEIVNYKIEDGVVTSDSYVTEEYLREHGYATTDYVDAKLTALKEEIEGEIETLVDPVVRPMVEEIIDRDIQPVDDDDVRNLFDE